MKVAVFGANGQIGRIFTEKWLKEDNSSIRALIRSKDQASFFEEKGAETKLVNLEGTVDSLTQAIDGCDAVVFTAGSGGSTGPDKTLLIDLDGAVKAAEAAKQAGIQRFIIVSAMGAGERERWSDSIKPYYAAKHYADAAVQESGLSYTIIRPGGLLNDPGTGRIQAAEQLESGSVSREDVAEVIVASLKNKSTENRAFEVIAGDSEINEALQHL
ncbi:SDR family oxidoreductase [Paenibacillus lemnae]|uniref:SDR family oxidoreductase n=1 Tax=Paenibacillus lemnae TaxID=1330551 RepID=A0A848M6T8_PAELE|nr:SDR family oxidoreductase [Paenibacillus lemnae]NMO95969.1 SDR family oxidoreductase [Paenibacillus lemnae]